MVTYPVERIQRFPVTVSAPAAGSEWSVTPTGRGAWRILTLRFTLVTAAAVANRTVNLFATDGTQAYFRSGGGGVQAAGATVNYGAMLGVGPATVQGSTAFVGWPQDGLVLAEGHQLGTATDNLQAADQYQNIGMLVEELPSGRFVYVTPALSAQFEEWNDVRLA